LNQSNGPEKSPQLPRNQSFQRVVMDEKLGAMFDQGDRRLAASLQEALATCCVHCCGAAETICRRVD